MSPPVVLAHGLGGRTDLPIPMWMVLYGGATVVVISFAALAVLWPRPRWADGNPGVLIGTAPRPAGSVAWTVARVLGLAVFLLVLAATIFGESDPQENLAPTFIYITFWVGLTFASGLVGDVWRALNPFDTLSRFFAGNSTGDAPRDPPALGYWPAVAGIFAFVWLELVYPDRTEPGVLGVAIGLYTGAVLIAAMAWGPGWLRQGEGFTALFGVLGHGGVLGRSGDERLRLRPPFAGLATLAPERGLQALVLVVLGSTTFDGLTRTPFWNDVSSRYSGFANTALGTAGLIWAILVVAVVYVGAIRVMARLVGDEDPNELMLAFAPSLVPIALAYSVAHYFSLFVLEGQGLLALLSDPFGFGWDVFGTADRTIDYALLSTATISYIQAGAIVAGHIAGVVVAHDRALALFGPRDATRSQYPLLAAMVTYTVGGLFLLLGG